MKSTVEEIRRRFDADVERFSNLQTGQSAAVDSPLAMDLAAQAAAAVTPGARDLLDIGCGAGNYTLKLLEYLPKLHVTDAGTGGAARAGSEGGECYDAAGRHPRHPVAHRWL
jgi:ubiquinone/menaquinone biosynthesis C-methylase UbiE